jgi:hypothetical protein
LSVFPQLLELVAFAFVFHAGVVVAQADSGFLVALVLGMTKVEENESLVGFVLQSFMMGYG